MQKSFKLILTFLISFTSLLSVYTQNEVKFKDVILDEKPAKLNVVTGEITLVKLESNAVETQKDSIKIQSINVTAEDGSTTLKKTEVSLDSLSDFYIVKKGDNLFQIAIKYNSSLGELQNANNLETTLIDVGQKLRVRNFNKVNNDEQSLIWIVNKGDNLYRIAKEKGTTVKALMRINSLKSDVIKIGQMLQLK